MKCVMKSDIERSDLHLTEFQRVGAASPVIPVHTVIGRLASCVVVAVQVGAVTILVPPGSFATRCTRV